MTELKTLAATQKFHPCLHAHRIIYFVFAISLCSAQNASAQSPARLQIMNAGINLGWTSGIIETEGVTAENITEIGANLANATNAITALVPLIEVPPYDTDAFVKVNVELNLLSGKIGGMPRDKAAHEISAIYLRLQSALRVYYSARTSKLTKGGTCDASTLDVGYYFGQGHTSLQRGNLTLERKSRGSMMSSIHTGAKVAKSLPCVFPSDEYLSAPVLDKPSVITYAESLAVIQNVAENGTLPTGVALDPAEKIPTAVAPSSAPMTPLTTNPPSPPSDNKTPPASTARPDLSKPWSSSWGSIHWDEGYYSTKTKTLTGKLVKINERWVFFGRWGRSDSDRSGQVMFTFKSPTAFEGYYTEHSKKSGSWNGSAPD